MANYNNFIAKNSFYLETQKHIGTHFIVPKQIT